MLRRTMALLLAAAPALAADGILIPSAFPPAPRRPWARAATVFSRREIVLDDAAGLALTPRDAVALRTLASNITVPTLDDRIRYSFYEAELDAGRLLVDGRARGGTSWAAAGFVNRFWLKADDGLGARRRLRKTFYGGMVLADRAMGRWTLVGALRALRVKEGGETVVTLGPSLRRALSPTVDAVVEVHPFLRNPLKYDVPWGFGIQWRPAGPLAVDLHLANVYGTTAPDTFDATPFPQVHLRLTARF